MRVVGAVVAVLCGLVAAACSGPRPTRVEPTAPAAAPIAPKAAPALPPGHNQVRVRDALSGVGAGDRDGWGPWRGQPVTINETWNDAKDNGVLTWRSMNALYTVNHHFAGGRWAGALSLAQPMFAQDETVNQCASVAEITTWATALKAAWPRADAYIRLGWEFNGDWYTWKMGPADGPAFKTCWIRWYDTVKQVSAGFKLVWNPNNESKNPGLDVRTFWPGSRYVDAAGPDNYAISDGGVLRDPGRLGPHGEPVGIDAWVTWVAEQGVPFAVPEWAIRDLPWGSTDPAFIEQMRAAFVRAAKSPTGLAYESYFDGSTTYNCQYSIHDSACGYGRHKPAADRYAALWSEPYPTP